MGGSSSAFTDGREDSTSNLPSGRVPNSPSVTNQGSSQSQAPQCCCVPSSSQCSDPLEGEQDLVGQGIIDARRPGRVKRQITVRIVNNPVVNSQQTSCPAGQKSCCYDPSVDVSALARGGCISPHVLAANSWTQGCSENQVGFGAGGKTCGTRNFDERSQSLEYGQAGVGEFPWTCLLLNQHNDFLGTCVVIPHNSGNDNSVPTRKVLTAAHKLKLGETDLLKVRVGEYDASGFTDIETAKHEEYTVTRILKHPQMSNGRLSNDIAILYVDRDISLSHPYVNTACLPSCEEQFNYQFSNGTGVRCWVAGWGRDEEDGSFQFIPKKVDLPLVEDGACQDSLRIALNNRELEVETDSTFTIVRSVLGGRLVKMLVPEMVGVRLFARLNLGDGLWSDL